MKEFLENIRSAWMGRSVANRSVLAVAAAAIVVLILVFSLWALRTDYQVLFSDLDTRDAAAIVEELKRTKVPYKLADGGTKILVEEKTVHETRLRLMGRGVPLSGGIGFEIFDNKDVGMTEYTQKINYQRALQGELARTIMAINQVKQARVHLVVTEGTLFKRQKVKPKASVSLVLKPGAPLSNEQIVGIQRLVAASVPGLEPNSVMVIDQAGVTLSVAGEDDEDYALASGKLRLKKNAEDYFIRKITAVLDRTFGPGQAIVSVDVTLNFDEVKRTQQTVVPLRANSGEEAGAVIRKRQSVYRQSKAPVTKSTDGEGSYVSGSPDLTSTTDVEYEVGKSVEQVVSSPGGIRRLSVGVVVPKVTHEQAQRIQDVVSMVVGYSASRGDAIAVQSIDQMLASPDPKTAREALDPAASSKNTANESQSAWARALTSPAVLLAIVTIFGLGLVGVAFVLGRAAARRREVASGDAGLTDEQRRARLNEIKLWLEAERTKGAA